MITVKQKLENKLAKWEKQFPQLVINQMHLGTKDHPNVKLWNETSNLVGTEILHKWRKLKYVLKIWDSSNEPKINYNNITSYLRSHRMSYYARLFEKEYKQQKENA